MSLIENMELLSTKCRGIRTHLAARGKSHGLSLDAAGTWGNSRLTAGMSSGNWSLFSEFRTPV